MQPLFPIGTNYAGRGGACPILDPIPNQLSLLGPVGGTSVIFTASWRSAKRRHLRISRSCRPIWRAHRRVLFRALLRGVPGYWLPPFVSYANVALGTRLLFFCLFNLKGVQLDLKCPFRWENIIVSMVPWPYRRENGISALALQRQGLDSPHVYGRRLRRDDSSPHASIFKERPS